MKPPVILFLLALGLGAGGATEPRPQLVGLFGGAGNIQLVREAVTVDACVLRHLPPATRPDGSVDRNSERFEETAFTPVPAPAAARLRDLLLDEKTYDWPAGSGGRTPPYSLRLRFHRGDEAIAVDFCLLCQKLRMIQHDEELGHASFGRHGDLFLQVFLKIFPQDERLQHLAREAGVTP